MNRISMLLEAVGACMINFVIEWISRHSFTEALNYLDQRTWAFAYNSFIIFITFSLVYLVRKRVFARVIITSLWLILGIINGVTLDMRVTPFNAYDLKMIEDAVTMIESYFTIPQLILLGAFLLTIIAWLVHVWRKGRKFKRKLYRIPMLMLCVVWYFALIFATDLAIEKRVISTYFGNLAFAYEDYGLPYCFMTSVFQGDMDKPTLYEESAIQDITHDGEMVYTETMEAEVKPNIIVVQLESFFDPEEVNFLEFSSDPIRVFRELSETYSSGYIEVPSVGAGTANTEFEMITGMNMRFFGPGEYPYKTIASETMIESAATALEGLGYNSYALHNNGGNFYSRAEVFNNLGFDGYVSEEFMNIRRTTDQGWATDRILVENIMDCLDTSKDSEFIFTITVEGHGSYPEEPVEDPAIVVSGVEDEGLRNSWEQYVNRVYAMDKFVDKLIREVEEREEPTVILFYGDHLPTMDIEESDLGTGNLFYTNYLIWDNIGLPEKDQNLTTYQAMAELFEQVGIQSGTMFNYHGERADTEFYVEDMEMLQYDLLYGKQYAYQEGTVLKEEGDMHMGVQNTGLHFVTQTKNLEGEDAVIFVGRNFTPWSRIYVNGKRQSADCLNEVRMDVDGLVLEDGDEIVIRQMGSSSTIFRSSATFVYEDGKIRISEPIKLGSSWVNRQAEILAGE